MVAVCLALALQGLAQARVSTPLCPTQESGYAKAMHAPNAAHACCNDADTYTKTGKACKVGEVCPVATAWLTSSQRSWSPPPATGLIVSPLEPFALAIDPRGQWRPPALS
jgi:hypothetical protein